MEEDYTSDISHYSVFNNSLSLFSSFNISLRKAAMLVDLAGSSGSATLGVGATGAGVGGVVRGALGGAGGALGGAGGALGGVGGA
ncbi:MAG: hypothetical protein ACE5R6_21635, partial [Candidatus Heimdallarchaeota archaeon]